MRDWRTSVRLALPAVVALGACGLPSPAPTVSPPVAPASSSATYSIATTRTREAQRLSTPSLVCTFTPTPEPSPLPSSASTAVVAADLAPSRAPATTRPVPTTLTTRACVVERARHYADSATSYQSGASGPTAFDCTGLVYRAFRDCGAAGLIGAQGQQPVVSYLRWFMAQGRADEHAPMAGDLIVYGDDCSHVAIYIGAGRAISTLSDGVREHDATRLHTHAGGDLLPIQAYLHIAAE